MPAPKKIDLPVREQEQALQDGPLAEMVGDTLRDDFARASGLGWLRWTGKVWEEVTEEVVVEAVRIELRSFVAAEILAGASPGRIRLLENLLNSGKIRAVTGLLRGVLMVDADSFDVEYDLLNAANGVIDLRTGELLPHDPKYRFTKITQASYENGARSRYWAQALRALPEARRQWMQIRLGQALTGYPPPDDLLPVSKGTGANGKSTFFDGVRFALGGFAGVVPDRLLTSRDGDHPTELTTLRGLRLAFLEELPEGGRLNVKRLKDIVGTESITARKIRENNITWRATHSLFITTNYTPRVNETDHGTWRRLALVRFPFTFRKPDAGLRGKFDRLGDATLRERMRYPSVQKAALAWLVEGAVAWYAADKTFPALPSAVEKATLAWRAEADYIFAFAADHLVWDSSRSILSGDLVTMFNAWLSRNGKPEWGNDLIVERFGSHHLAQDNNVTKGKLRVKEGQVSRPPVADGPHIPGPARDVASVVGKQLAQWVGVAWREGDE